MAKKKGISNQILDVALQVAIQQIDKHNYGVAKEILHSIRSRARTYLLKKEVPDGEATVSTAQKGDALTS